MGMKLTRFKVFNFRSIEESDWIELVENNCLIGTNEAGKTNLLVALWKLKPANDEPIIPLDDFPRHLYSIYKAGGHSKDVFIAADFELDATLQQQASEELKADIEQVKTVLVKRKYNSDYEVTFPYSKIDSYPSTRFTELVDNFLSSLQKQDAFLKEEENNQKKFIDYLTREKENIKGDIFKVDFVEEAISSVESYMNENFGKKVNLPEFVRSKFIRPLSKFKSSFEGKPVTVTDSFRDKILSKLPTFVYYSDYGNLDSEIFLPRVIEDFERDDLSETARAKARTLQVLFKYVNLSPKEIYELGNDRKVVVKKIDHRNNTVISTKEEDLTDEEIRDWSDRKRERAILLNSAASELTKSFRKWWMQGNYIFSFVADGNHFRINVSDDLRPEPIELEGRSRGLQWFFSFFLVFLVETKEEHSNSILLLDEPGLSLHPIAQYDLVKFFRTLSIDNQLIYTSHSPFLVDMDNLANVKVVYLDSESGRTKISANLRYDEKDAEKSIYPVHAALGLTVSDTLLLGCLPILVEGPSDQIYLSMIKRYLMGKGHIKNTKELVFIPTGGIKGMGPVTKLVSSREDELPLVLLDSDSQGSQYAKQLKTGRYRDQQDKVLQVNDFIKMEGGFEIEDLLPSKALIPLIDRAYRSDNFFDDYFKKDKPIVDQIEEWARINSVTLEKGWKVELARTVQNRFDKMMDEVTEEQEETWKSLFMVLFQKETVPKKS